MQLSKRLEAIAQMVRPGSRLVDVGCDHGYLPIALVLRKIIPSAIAMDVRPGPLKRAQENIDAYGLNPYIETRISDGLEALGPSEGETLTIAGMGGPLMEQILDKKMEIGRGFQELIFQPQSETARFRRYLMEHRFLITAEDMVVEEGKYYTIIKAVPSENPPLESYDKAEYLYGKFLLDARHPVLYSYLQHQSEKNQEIYRRLLESQTPNALQRAEEILEERQILASAMKKYESQ